MNRRYIIAGLFFLSGILSLEVCADEPRVALVSRTKSGNVGKTLDLATVSLASDTTMVLLDRQEIGRILAEQKLKMSGYVDAEEVSMLGRILKVQLFAVVENGTQGEGVSGFSVYDAATGLRYWDETLSVADLEKTAERIRQIVKASLAKQRTPAGELKGGGRVTSKHLTFGLKARGLVLG
jgi:hypothetical protein